MKKAIVFLCLLFPYFGISQLELTNNFENHLIDYNPAYSGAFKKLDVGAWTTLQQYGASTQIPVLIGVNGSYAINKNHAVSTKMMIDLRYGEHSVFPRFGYTGIIFLKDSLTLSLGLNVGLDALRYSLNYADATLIGRNYFAFNTDAGAVITNKKFHAGVSVLSAFRATKRKEEFPMPIEFAITGGYNFRFNLNKNEYLQLETNALLEIQIARETWTFSIWRIIGSVNLWWRDVIYVGVGYGNDNNIAVKFGAQYKGIELGYYFAKSLTITNPFNYHGLKLGFSLNYPNLESERDSEEKLKEK